jgi:autotransporter-associated beta strand protein
MIVAATLDAIAATYYWDTNGAASGLGSSSSPVAWLTNSWAVGSSGTAATGPWPNSQPDNDDQAIFTGSAGTVNVDADVFANALRFEASGYTVAGAGGALHLVGDNPTIDVTLPSNNNTATISAPILGDNGLTLVGNSLSGGLKFLVLANTSVATPNAFSGTLTVDAGGALRLGGGAAREQIPDQVDLAISGVIDFITSGGASDGKQERVRDVAVSGTNANFSVGNEADFIVNSMSGSATGSGPGISVNGNSGLAPNVPGRLIINGWADGAGDLTLDDSRVRVNTTGANNVVGGRVLLSGSIYSSGSSEISNSNGNDATPDNNFYTNKGFDFTSAAHTICVADGALLFTSRSPSRPLEVTSTNAGGATLTKTGAGVWLWEHAVQTSFSGVNRVEAGTWRLGASQRLADDSALEVAGGVFDMQAFAETIDRLLLDGGMIVGASTASLVGTSYDVRAGVANVRLGGGASLEKSTTGTVGLNGENTYAGTTTVIEGTLLVNGTHTGGDAYTVAGDATLGGTGFVDAPVSIANGTLAPGAGVGTFTANNAVTFEAGSHYAVEIAGAAADKLISIDLNLSASEFLDVSVLEEMVGASWLIAEYSGTLDGQFDAVTAGFAVDYDTPGEIHLQFVAVPGDYNSNGVVDAADYTVWRDTLGDQVTPGTGADGTGPGGSPDGVVDQLDYQLWVDHFGEAAPDGGSNAIVGTVPEPSAISLACLSIGCVLAVATDRKLSA